MKWHGVFCGCTLKLFRESGRSHTLWHFWQIPTAAVRVCVEDAFCELPLCTCYFHSHVILVCWCVWPLFPVLEIRILREWITLAGFWSDELWRRFFGRQSWIRVQFTPHLFLPLVLMPVHSFLFWKLWSLSSERLLKEGFMLDLRGKSFSSISELH